MAGRGALRLALMRVLVTGPGGFVGRALVPLLLARGHEVVRAGRREVGEIGPETAWDLAGVEAVVHLAALVHDRAAGAADFDRVNRLGTARLADAARSAGIRRFVFLSTAKATAETSEHPLRETETPRPEGAYAVSKLAAEATLPEALILRPPLVHGADAGANFRALLRLCRSGLPLPFAGIENRRSAIAVGNLADAILRALEGPRASGVYHLRDGDFSTPRSVALLRRAMGMGPRLFALPPPLRRHLPRPLTQSLQLDDGAFRRDFGWAPPVDAETALAETARGAL
jgi:nucleoside-diphosphate-sugar epimerase